MRGTIKDAINQDDDNLPRLLACIKYDTNSVNIWSNFTKNIHKRKKSFVKNNYFSFNIIGDYDFIVEEVVVPVQLCLQYRVQHLLCQRKRRRKLFLWDLSVATTNE